MKTKIPSLRNAIDNMCKDMSYDPLDEGTWRQQVAACTAKDCPLYNVRPVGNKNNTTYLTMNLLNHWNIKPEDLDNRARSILRDAPEA